LVFGIDFQSSHLQIAYTNGSLCFFQLDIYFFAVQKEGFEAEFEVLTDDTGKLKAVNVTSADGSPCPGPDARKRRPKKSTSGVGKGEKDVTAASGDDGENKNGSVDEGKSNDKGNSGKKPRRRNRNNGSKKGANGTVAPSSAEAKKEDSWDKILDENVQEALKSKNITVNGGRAFLAFGDARIKLGTDGYAALAHSTAVLAEGSWTVIPSGAVTFMWERVLKLDENEWVLSTVLAEKEVLINGIDFSDGT
jgi:hypothetical protein